MVSVGEYPIQPIIDNQREDFVVVEMRGIVFCSVYLPPVGSDVYFCSASLIGDNNWRVCDDNISDHNTIKFVVGRAPRQSANNLGHTAGKVVHKILRQGFVRRNLEGQDIFGHNATAEELTQAITVACDGAMATPKATGPASSLLVNVRD